MSTATSTPGEHPATDMKQCIEDCERCYRVCFSMAMNHCLEQGGPHVEPAHFRLMIICAELCRVTADAMLANFALHEELCRACSRVCAECAESCRKLDGMEECVDACEHCAKSCAAMLRH
jgi:hypothetical protein|nr:four-helix bundle copper-binding protein [uncultured Steroidobacter sp.]